jgi:hypothetical protein
VARNERGKRKTENGECLAKIITKLIQPVIVLYSVLYFLSICDSDFLSLNCIFYIWWTAA